MSSNNNHIKWKEGTENNLHQVLVNINNRPGIPGQKCCGSKFFRQSTNEATQNIRNSRVANAKKNKAPDEINGRINPSGVGAIARNFGPQPLKIGAHQFSKKILSQLIDKPGGNQVLKINSKSKCCDSSGNNELYYKYYDKLWNKDISFNYQHDHFKDCSSNPGICKRVCVACNPENNIIKSAVTLLNKNYYTDSRAYLKSRGKTYDQKLSFNTTDSSNCPLPPSNTYKYPMTTTIDKCQYNKSNKCGYTIYKPNNSQFQVQGAVSSSSRIAKLKYDTMINNGASFKSAKINKCINMHRNGNKTRCHSN